MHNTCNTHWHENTYSIQHTNVIRTNSYSNMSVYIFAGISGVTTNLILQYRSIGLGETTDKQQEHQGSRQTLSPTGLWPCSLRGCQGLGHSQTDTTSNWVSPSLLLVNQASARTRAHPEVVLWHDSVSTHLTAGDTDTVTQCHCDCDKRHWD